MMNTQILASGHFVPEKTLTNDDLSKFLDTNDQWIRERTGIKERRVCDPSKDEFPSTMAMFAAKEALKKAEMDANEIDLILFSTTIPDYLFPNTATVLQEKLGISNKCPCMDINAACSGWLYGMVVADSLIKTGTYKNILLIGCEMTSAFNAWKDRSTAVLFGDGCGAVILSATKENQDSKIIDFILGSDSSKKDSLKLDNGGAVSPVNKAVIERDESLKVTFDGQTVFKNAVKTMASHCVNTLEKSGVSKDEVDWFIPHQANQRIIEAVANRMDFPKEKIISNVEFYANTSSASIPIALNEALNAGKIKRGDNILFTAFGAGLTSAAVLIKY